LSEAIRYISERARIEPGRSRGIMCFSPSTERKTVTVTGLEGLSATAIFELSIALKLEAQRRIGTMARFSSLHLFPGSGEVEIAWKYNISGERVTESDTRRINLE
jgi:hypothetical protein